jgi:hypothetical protein
VKQVNYVWGLFQNNYIRVPRMSAWLADAFRCSFVILQFDTITARSQMSFSKLPLLLILYVPVTI